MSRINRRGSRSISRMMPRPCNLSTRDGWSSCSARASSTYPALSATMTIGVGSWRATIPQGHPNGYPVYRLEWQSLGSVQRRLRNCLFGMRAEPYTYGAPEMTTLELFLAWRGRGLMIEAPAVRP